MPTTKSAAKRLRQSIVNRARNRAAKSMVKTMVKRVRDAVVAKDLKKAGDEFALAAKKIDQVCAKGIIHRNTAARHKSRLSHLLKKAAGK